MRATSPTGSCRRRGRERVVAVVRLPLGRARRALHARVGVIYEVETPLPVLEMYSTGVTLSAGA